GMRREHRLDVRADARPKIGHGARRVGIGVPMRAADEAPPRAERPEELGGRGTERHDARRTRRRAGPHLLAEIIRARGARAGALAARERGEAQDERDASGERHERASSATEHARCTREWWARAATSPCSEGLRTWRGREASPGFGPRARLPSPRPVAW